MWVFAQIEPILIDLGKYRTLIIWYQDVAAAVRSLAVNMSITGQNLIVDSGFTIWYDVLVQDISR